MRFETSCEAISGNPHFLVFVVELEFRGDATFDFLFWSEESEMDVIPSVDVF